MSEHGDLLPQENKDELPEHETREAGEDTGGLVDEAGDLAGGDGLPRAEDGEPAIDPDGGFAPPAHR